MNGCQSSGRANTQLQQTRRVIWLNLQRLPPSFVIIDTAREHDNKPARGLYAGVNCGEIALLSGVRGLRAFEGVGRARRGLEVVAHWLYKHDASLQLPYQDNLSATSTSRRSAPRSIQQLSVCRPRSRTARKSCYLDQPGQCPAPTKHYVYQLRIGSAVRLRHCTPRRFSNLPWSCRPSRNSINESLTAPRDSVSIVHISR